MANFFFKILIGIVTVFYLQKHFVDTNKIFAQLRVRIVDLLCPNNDLPIRRRCEPANV